MQDDLIFDAGGLEQGSEALVVALDAYEGPLDVLLSLARTQKVDLRRISILRLAEQYLEFVEEAKRLRLELAADYLVMAAWLAYLKSRLLLPPDPQEDGPSAEELATHLAFQLERLEAMRKVAAKLMARDQLGRDFFSRGEEETIRQSRKISYTANLVELMRAYAGIRTRDEFRPLHLEREPVMTMEAALERLRGLIGATADWSDLVGFLPTEWRIDPARRRSALAATFAAALELAKEGKLDIQQHETFAPITIRSREAGS